MEDIKPMPAKDRTERIELLHRTWVEDRETATFEPRDAIVAESWAKVEAAMRAPGRFEGHYHFVMHNLFTNHDGLASVNAIRWNHKGYTIMQRYVGEHRLHFWAKEDLSTCQIWGS